MMNAKSRMRVFYAEGIIEMNTTFAKMIENPLSDEYALLQKLKMENPEFKVSRRKIKSNPNKDSYKGLTYEYMKMYIKTHETEEQAKEIIQIIARSVDFQMDHPGAKTNLCRIGSPYRDFVVCITQLMLAGSFNDKWENVLWNVLDDDIQTASHTIIFSHIMAIHSGRY